jgi:hypothetical protein
MSLQRSAVQTRVHFPRNFIICVRCCFSRQAAHQVVSEQPARGNRRHSVPGCRGRLASKLQSMHQGQGHQVFPPLSVTNFVTTSGWGVHYPILEQTQECQEQLSRCSLTMKESFVSFMNGHQLFHHQNFFHLVWLRLEPLWHCWLSPAQQTQQQLLHRQVCGRHSALIPPSPIILQPLSPFIPPPSPPSHSALGSRDSDQLKSLEHLMSELTVHRSRFCLSIP